MKENRVSQLLDKEEANILKRKSWLDELGVKLKEKGSAKVFISGICGTGTSAVASLLKKKGFEVIGSDKAFYPPMGDVVRGLASKIYEGYSASNLDSLPDFVVIGNSISKDNPEYQRVLNENIPHASMPEVFSKFLIGARTECANSVVISGTHGKTTTTAMLSVLLKESGKGPGYFVGGFVEQLSGGLEIPKKSLPFQEKIVVLEGDEYDSALFAKWSKFHSYRPDFLVITSLEFDHADIFENISDIVDEFEALVKSMPENSQVFIADTYPLLLKLKEKWEQSLDIKARLFLYGESEQADYRIISRETGSFGQKLGFQLNEEKVFLETPISGKQNAFNLLAVSAVAKSLKLSVKEISENLGKFSGVKKRQQKVFDNQKTVVIEDFAHHPTAVNLTLQGLKETFPERKLIAVFEPRSNTSKRDFFQKEYAESFEAADFVLIKEVSEDSGYSKNKSQISELNTSLLKDDLNAQKKKEVAFSLAEVSELHSKILELKSELEKSKEPSLFVIMSNGDFGGLKKKVLESFS